MREPVTGGDNSHPGGWTPERVARLKKLWLEGKSAAEISRDLGGGVTRSGVIGKCHRLGLSGAGRAGDTDAQMRNRTSGATSTTNARVKERAMGLIPPAKPGARRPIGGNFMPQAGKPIPPTPLPAEPVLSAAPGMVSLLQLGAHMCKWPIGDPHRPGFGFCGRRALEHVYCPEHHAVSRSSSVGPLGKAGATAQGLERQLRRFI